MPNAIFATTHWSVVLCAGGADSTEGRAALEQLCRSYWYPIYAEVRRRGHGEHDAQDLTQEFFACLLRRDSFAAACPRKGRFRSYLLGALDYFLSDIHARNRAAKRGGGQSPIPLDELEAEACYQADAASADTPDRAFDRRWLVAVLDAGLRVLEAEQTAAGKAAQFARLKPFLACEIGSGDYQQVAAELGQKPGTVAVAVHRLRQRYQEIIRTEVRQTLTDPDDLDHELRHLFGG
jgi:RNA polymerase sigma-70 factor (ECF subfamily)